MKRRTIIFVLAGLAVLVAIAVFVDKRSGVGRVAVHEVVLREEPFQLKLPETGVVQRPQLVTVPAEVPGNVARLLVKAGDRVVRGQLLAAIDNPQITANYESAAQGATSASARAGSIRETNAALPAQNRSSVVQAQAAVVQARTALGQARQDLVSGSQSGLGYGGQTAEEQRVLADANVSRAQTDLREAKRLYDANRYLYSQQAVSRDTLDQSQAKYQEAGVAAQQAVRQREILGGTLSRETQVLRDRVGAAEDALNQAQAQLASARAVATQTKAGDLEAAVADAGKARGDLGYARDQVARLEIRAPITGTVQAVATETGDALRPIQAGDSVVAGEALFTLAAEGGFIVRTRVDEQDVANITLGQHANVSGEDFEGKTLTGHVVSISPVAQKSDDPSNTSRQVLTTIALDRTLPFLRDGMTVDVDIVTLDRPRALAVPNDALHRDGGSAYVYVDRGGHALRMPVRTGEQNDRRIAIASGLHPGDVVIADKNPAVKPQAEVTAAPAATPAAAT